MAGYSVNGREDMTRVKPHERRQRILDRVLEYDSVTVDDLADEFGLTKMSVRRDLNALAENGQVARVRGGATRPHTPVPARRYVDAQQRNAQAKARIARAAAPLLGPAVSAFFYSGSTVARVVEALTEDQHDQLTVVTNSVPVINTVTTWNDAHLVAVGGLYLPAYMAFVGPQAIEPLRSLSADVAVGMRRAEHRRGPDHTAPARRRDRHHLDRAGPPDHRRGRLLQDRPPGVHPHRAGHGDRRAGDRRAR